MDFREPGIQLLNFLECPTIVNQMRNIHASIYFNGKMTALEGGGDDPKFAEGRLPAARSSSLRFYMELWGSHIPSGSEDEWPNAVDFFHQNVISKLPRPAPVTAYELYRAFADHMCVDQDAFDAGYQQFLGCIERRIIGFRQSIAFAIATTSWGSDDANSLDLKPFLFDFDANQDLTNELNSERCLWAYHGILLRIADIRQENSSTATLLADICGYHSQSVNDELSVQFPFYVRSILRSLAAISRSYCFVEKSLPKIDLKHIISEDGYAYFIRECLDAVMNKSRKSTPLDRRIGNAVELLAIADQQSDMSIALSLSVVAIEALLGSGSEISEKLAMLIAKLLEPELKYRAAARRYVKSVYSLRSRILHGDTEHDASKIGIEDVRCLGASALFAFVEYVSCIRKMGDSDCKRDEVLSRLDDERDLPGVPDGVNTLPIHRLWRSL